MAAFLAASAVAMGCGAEDAAEDAVKDASGFNDAIEDCKKSAEGISDPQGRETALAACRAAEGGEAVDPGELRDSAYDQCLETARDGPDRESRRQARRACEDIK